MTPPALPSCVAPVEDKVVNAPVFGVVAPMAVPLIPVAVVLKLPDVKVKLLAPVLIDVAPSPDKFKAPDVAVRFKAPVVWVNPLEAVKVWLEVKAPLLVVVTPALPMETDVAFVFPRFKAVPASRVKDPPDVKVDEPVGVKLTDPAPLAVKFPEVKV